MLDTDETLWPELLHKARVALRDWDAWCADDPRPQWALDAAEAYWQGRGDKSTLASRQSACSQAAAMCARAADYWEDGVLVRPPCHHALGPAWHAAWTALVVSQAVLYACHQRDDHGIYIWREAVIAASGHLGANAYTS